MSDAPFGSPDSEAAWTALGNRMRKNRMWLLMMFVALGFYLAAQSWARLRRDGFDVDALARGVALSGSSAETAALPTPPSAAPIAARDSRAPRPLQSSTPSTGPTSKSASASEASSQVSEAKAARSRTRQVATGRSQGQASTGAPATPATSPPGGSPGAGATGQRTGARSAMTNQGSPTGGPSRAGAAPGQPREIEAMGESIGEWLAQWQNQREESRREGWRIAASAVGRYARMPSRPIGPAPESLPTSQGTEATAGAATAEAAAARKGAAATESTATAEGTPSDVRSPHEIGQAIPQPGAREAIQPPRPRYSSLSIHNPARTGGAVHYLVNGQEHTLRPGESQELPSGRWLIEFHRGGDYGDAASTLAGGSYRFEITASGWELRQGE